MKDMIKKISWKIKFGMGAVWAFVMAYLTMMGYATKFCSSVESEMFLFILFGLMGCLMTFLVFVSEEK